MDELISPELVEHQDFGPITLPAPKESSRDRLAAACRRAFSDFQLAIDDLAVDGDTVWLRMTGTGANDGSFMGHAPTGRSMRIHVFDSLRVAEGRIVEHWGVPDRLGVLFQLGLVQR